LALIPIGRVVDDRAVQPLLLPFLWERMDDAGDHLLSEARPVCRTEKLPCLGTQALASFLPDFQTKAVSAQSFLKALFQPGSFDQHLWVETEAAHMLSGLGFSLRRLASVAEESKRLPHTLSRFRRISMSRSHCRKDHQRVEVFLDRLARFGDPERRQLGPSGLPHP